MLTTQVCSILSLLAEQVESPRSQAVLMLADDGAWAQLQRLAPCDPNDYDDPMAYKLDAILTNFARKSPPLPGVDLHEVAVGTFFTCERQNSKTSSRLIPFIDFQGPFDPISVKLVPFFQEWRREVKRVLGKLPDSIGVTFSPGATVTTKGDKSTIMDKLSSPPVFYSPELACFIDRTQWGALHRDSLLLTDSNEFFSVPKDSTTNRGCCKEALGAVSLQLEIKDAIRKRLKSHLGIDLATGQLLHQELARAGSLGRKAIATIDLKNASDTIVDTLCRIGLPDDWYACLAMLRAGYTIVDGKRVKIHKFSAMGNGFTFDLETLIFATLARTCLRHHDVDQFMSCYGDDLIVSNDPAFLAELYAAFEYCGFTINTKKSFVSGPFRESCGGDFFNGLNVRAHYQGNYLDEPQHWISLYNSLKRLDVPWVTGEAMRYCLAQLPLPIRNLKGPPVLGDVVLHSDSPPRTFPAPVFRDPLEKGIDGDTWDGVWVKAYVPVVKLKSLKNWHPRVQLAGLLYGVGSQGVAPRSEHVSGYKIAKIFVRRGYLA